MDIYQAGYITAVTGSSDIEGFGTRWLNYVKPGDQLMLDGNAYGIGAVTDNHKLQLSAVYTGPELDRVSYEIQLAPRVATLQQLKAAAVVEIDRVAGMTRAKYITVAAGQEATYTAKLADANAYIAAGYPADATPYVWISTEATANNSTPKIVADLIVATAAQWAIVGAKIEGARIAAKRAVNDAADNAAIVAAEQAFKSVMALL